MDIKIRKKEKDLYRETESQGDRKEMKRQSKDNLKDIKDQREREREREKQK